VRWREEWERGADDSRLSRGRSYARKGQVFSLVAKEGEITGKVQGSQSHPYRSSLSFPVLSAKQWEEIFACLRKMPLEAAKLLGGELSEETAVVLQKYSLFLKKKQISMSCSCFDWGAPCKHLAALGYLVAEQIDEDPLFWFALRGCSREMLLEALGSSQKENAEKVSFPVESLSTDPSLFWGSSAQAMQKDLTFPLRLLEDNACLLDALGSFPFWQGEFEMVSTLRPLYQAAQRLGCALASGEAGETDEEASTG
jgi:uncharacterized Zn finger protein